MRHYEQVLDKIAPTFYKSIQYKVYFDNNNLGLVDPYLGHAKIYGIGYYPIYLPEAININYHYYLGHYYLGYAEKTESGHIIMLTAKREISVIYKEVSLIELIINIVINNSFKNEDYLKLFIALVGKDMYETLRANIR